MIYEQVRAEALQPTGAPPSWALERMRRYGVVGLLPGASQDFPFILYAQRVPRPAWSGTRDVHRETLHRVYACLLTAGAERQGGEPVDAIVDTVDPTDRVVDAPADAPQWLDISRGVTHASGAVCPGVQ